ncbi:MAG TPA: twin-arginine translocase subunit TatC [Anaerolineaceae bacterium]|nr:twin-arginine translocase subunit TatC [Anaerolineaceae bacterium]HPS32065.1 twin-arginine translocase subunit TatC [Anaerolineaceae bacterium]
MEPQEEGLTIPNHLEEFRSALLRALLGLGAAIVVSLFFTSRLIDFLARPIGGLEKLQAIEVTETVSVYMRVALLAGFILASPWIFYQLFGYLAKGLKAEERSRVLVAVPFAVLFFAAGAAFAYIIMLPSALNFFAQFLGVQTLFRIKSYFSFVTDLIFWIGVSFELPLLVFVLARIGIVNASMLIKGWRAAVVVIAVLAAVITPTADPVNMAIFMLPLFGLYLLSIGLAALAGKKRAAAEQEQET